MSPVGTTAVIIPVFNGERFLGAAIESALGQTRVPEEIIVIDDGSTDRSAQIARGYAEVRLVQQTNAGPAAARNAGIIVAESEYIALLDADDLWPENRMAIMAGILDRDPDVGGVLGRQRLLADPGAPLPPWVPVSTDPEAIDPVDLDRPTGFLVRRSLFDTIGLYDESMIYGEDVDWYLRCVDAGVRWELIEDVTQIRRLHTTNLTHDAEAVRRSHFRILQKRMARRRAQ